MILPPHWRTTSADDKSAPLTAQPRARAIAGVVTLLLASACSSPPVSTDAGAANCPNDPATTCRDDAGTQMIPLGPAPNCPNDFPSGADCAAAAPHYADVAPIFAAKCSLCHGPGGVSQTIPFATYDDIIAANTAPLRNDVRDQINSCFMPPGCSCPLTDAERHTLLEWFVCGALGP